MLVVSLFCIGSATRRWWPAGPQKFMVVYHITLYFTLKKRNPNCRSISRRMTSRRPYCSTKQWTCWPNNKQKNPVGIELVSNAKRSFVLRNWWQILDSMWICQLEDRGGWVPENRRVGEVREGHLKIFEIISTQSGVLGMKIVLKSYP